MKSYSEYLSEIFPGVKVQKLSIDAGFSCPNRDGTIGTGGCIYCRNDSFTPSYCDKNKSISLQIEEGKKFFRRKYPDMKFIAYFQSYTNTYNATLEYLENLYREAINYEDVVGLAIGTRPDTLSDEIISLLKEINSEKPVFLEIGAETSHEETLRLINRNHRWRDVESAIIRASRAALHCGIHLIAGLPGENVEMMLATIKKVSGLPVDTIKLHQLQILVDTPLYRQWIRGEISVHEFSLEEYLELCVKIVSLIPRHIVIERFTSQSPPSMVIAPKWNVKNYEFTNRLKNMIKRSGLD